MDMNVLQNMTLIDFIIGGSTGEKTTSGDDFERKVGKMLPKGTFTWISKYRSQAKRELLKFGAARKVDNRIRGYFVPMEHAAGRAKVLNEIKAEYLKEKAEFLDKLPTIVEDWASKEENQVVTSTGALRADLIRAHAPKREELERLLSFSVSSVMLQATGFFGEDDALNKEVGGLAGQAAIEIAEDVNKSWKSNTLERTTHRTLSLVRRICQKASAMGVLSTKFHNLERMCKQVLEAIPAKGTIEGVEFLQLSALLNFCSDPDNILDEQAIKFDPLDVKLPPSAPKAEAVAPAAAQAEAADTTPPVEETLIAEPAPAAATQLDLVDAGATEVIAEVQAPAETQAVAAPAATTVEPVVTVQAEEPAPVAQSAVEPEPEVILEF